MPDRRKPTYGAATRLARLVYELASRPHGWSFEAIADEIGISERTLLRYLRACREELVHPDGHPVLEVVRRGERRMLRLAEPAPATEAGVYQAVSLYLTLSVLAFLEGTVLRQGAQDIWERLERALPPRQRSRLANIARKFYAVPFLAKDYRAHDDLLDGIVRCLIDQRRMRIDYGGVVGEGQVHDFDPYTLAVHRGGLYLIGYSHRYHRIVWLAVERIRRAETLQDRFDYPMGYSPAAHTEGMFGIIEGPVTYVELLLLNPETTAFLSARRIHPTQQFRRRRDGTTLLSMKVRGTNELASWILSLTPWVRVLRPSSLRDEVAGRLRDATRLYEQEAR
jgi:predicted DNA-binding transcriptional regulator YafY